MEKKYIIGSLAVVGAIALIAYLNKPRKNRDGFYSANGRTLSSSSLSPRAERGRCAMCKDSAGNVYRTGEDRKCSGSDVCVTRYAFID